MAFLVTNIRHPRSEYVPLPWIDVALNPPPPECLAPSVTDLRARSAKRLDVKSIPPPDTDWLYNTLNPPVTVTEVLAPLSWALRSKQRKVLDVRGIPAPDSDWLYNTLFPPAVGFNANLWPSVEQLLDSFRTKDKKKLDVRGSLQPDFSGPTFATEWAAAFEALRRAKRTEARKPVNVRHSTGSDFVTMGEAPPPPEEFLAPSIWDLRTRSKKWLNVRAITQQDLWPTLIAISEPQLGYADGFIPVARKKPRHITQPNTDWLFNSLPVGPAFNANLWPTIEELTRAYRTVDRRKHRLADLPQADTDWLIIIPPPQLIPVMGMQTRRKAGVDARGISGPDIDWLFNSLPVAPPQEILAPLIWSLRSRARAKLRIINQPNTDWMFNSLPVAPTFNANLWPAIEALLRAQRTADRKPLNRQTYPADFATPNAEENWTTIFSSELLAARSMDRQKLKLANIPPSDINWLFPILTAPPPFNANLSPAMEELARAYRVIDRRKIRLADIPIPDINWLNNLLVPPFNPQLWPGIEELIRAYRTGPRRAGPPISQPMFTWQMGTINNAIAAQRPALDALLKAERSRARKPVNVRITKLYDAWVQDAVFAPWQVGNICLGVVPLGDCVVAVSAAGDAVVSISPMGEVTITIVPTNCTGSA